MEEYCKYMDDYFEELCSNSNISKRLSAISEIVSIENRKTHFLFYIACGKGQIFAFVERISRACKTGETGTYCIVSGNHTKFTFKNKEKIIVH